MDNKYLQISREFIKDFTKDPLLFLLAVECARRARRVKEPSPDGLKQGEFWLSETEYKKFGLAKNQHGKIERRMSKLILLKIVLKTGSQIGSEQSNVYRFVKTKYIDPNYETGNETGSEQGASRERAGSTNNVIMKKKVTNKKSKSLAAKKTADKDKFINNRYEILREVESLSRFKTKDCLKVMKDFLHKVKRDPMYMDKYEKHKSGYMNWLDRSPDIYVGQVGKVKREQINEAHKNPDWKFDY